MNNDTLLETLKSDSMSFTLAEIEEMMDDELSKEPGEMDTKLIDICADIINKAYAKVEEDSVSLSVQNQKLAENASKENKNKKIKFGKILLAAAIVAIICAMAVPVGAKFVRSEASDNIVRFFDNHFNIDLKKGDTDAGEYSDTNNDLVQQIQDAGIDNVILPAVLLSDQYKTEITFTNDDEFYTEVEIDFQSNDENISGNIAIAKHKTDYTLFIIGQGQMAEQYDTAKQITVNGMDVLVFGGNNIAPSIEYVDKITEYSIVLEDNCTFEQAVGIAESLEQ